MQTLELPLLIKGVKGKKIMMLAFTIYFDIYIWIGACIVNTNIWNAT